MAKPIVSGSPEPVPTLPLQLQCVPALRDKLDQAHLCADRLAQVLLLTVYALREQGCDIDEGAAVTLESAFETELDVARSAIEDALDLLKQLTPGVSHG